MKNKKLLQALSIAVIALLAIAEILTLTIVLKTNLLPAKYTIAMAMIFLVCLIGTGLLLFVRGKKPMSRFFEQIEMDLLHFAAGPFFCYRIPFPPNGN